MPNDRGASTLTLIAILMLALSAALGACDGMHSRHSVVAFDSTAVDSAQAYALTAYDVGYNFTVRADSLMLMDERPMHWSEGVSSESGTVMLHAGDRIVVASIVVIPEDTTDSIWVQVARDQQTMGWTHQGTLLQGTSPDDPISTLMHYIARRPNLVLMLLGAATLALCLLYRHRHPRTPLICADDITAAAPSLLLSCAVAAALLHTYIMHAVPQEWVRFYFHPSINPLTQPPALRAFIIAVWGMVAASVASAEAAFTLLPLRQAPVYLLSLAAMATILTEAITMLQAIPLLAAATGLAAIAGIARHYMSHTRARYICGRCGTGLHDKGRCPRCGAWND